MKKENRAAWIINEQNPVERSVDCDANRKFRAFPCHVYRRQIDYTRFSNSQRNVQWFGKSSHRHFVRTNARHHWKSTCTNSSNKIFATKLITIKFNDLPQVRASQNYKKTSSSLKKLSTFPSNTNTYWKFTQSSTAAIDAASSFILTRVHHETRNKQSISKSYLLSHPFQYFDRTSHLERNVSTRSTYSLRTYLGYTHADDNLSLSLALIKSSVSSSFKNKKVVLKSRRRIPTQL